jgi:hypothetical protein
MQNFSQFLKTLDGNRAKRTGFFCASFVVEAPSGHAFTQCGVNTRLPGVSTREEAFV